MTVFARKGGSITHPTPSTINDSVTLTGASATGSAGEMEAGVPASETLHKIMVPDDWGGTLHDESWIESEPTGSVKNFVKTKQDLGNQAPTLSISAGAGPSGEDCLAITVEAGSDRLPAFWVIPAKTGVVGTPRPTTWATAHVVGDGEETYQSNVNKIRMLCKWPTGYRIADAASLPPEYPNHQNINFGTYVATEATIQAKGFETSNWHFYHFQWQRHDLSDGNWVTIEVGNKPSHQRAGAGANGKPVPAGPVRLDTTGAALATAHSAGDGYWGLVTRFYFDAGGGSDYNSDPEISLPYTLLVAGIWGIEETLTPYYTITPTNFTDSNTYVLTPGSGTQDFDFSIQEARGVADDCYFIRNGFSKLKHELLEGGSTVTEPLSFSANETKNLTMRVSPAAEWSQNYSQAGYSFLPARRIDVTSSYRNRNDTESTVEKRWPDKSDSEGQLEEAEHGDVMVYIKPS